MSAAADGRPYGEPLQGEVMAPVEHENAVRQAEAIAKIFDTQFRIAGVPFGLDAIIGLIPVVGDVASGAVGLYFLKLAKEIDLPKHKMAIMIANIGVDTAIGSVPLVGDLFDIGWRAHRRNAKILRKHITRK